VVYQQIFALKAPKSLRACEFGKAINYFLSGASVLAALSMLLLFAAPAFAGDFEDGCKSYTSKDYRSAKVSFEKVVSVYPKFALGHYYLGNVLLSSGQVAKAKVEYQICLNGKPDPTTAKYCQAVLAKLGTAGAATGVASISGTGTSASGSGSTMVAAFSGSPIQPAPENAAEEKKKAIMDKAEKEIRALRADCQSRLDRGDVNVSTNNRYHIGPDGSVVHHYTPETRAIVEGECEAQCDHIRYMAEQQCKFIK
jgi:hypothetical protein